MRSVRHVSIRSLVFVGSLLCGLSAAHAETFPTVDQLPSRPELPDPLKPTTGPIVRTVSEWEMQRRPELAKLISHYMYGQLPERMPVLAAVEMEDTKAYSGKATLRDITLRMGNADAPPVHLLLVIPNDGKKTHPIFVGMNFAGNHAATDHPKVRINPNWIYPKYPGVTDNRATEASRGSQVDVWAIDQAIARGYAVALVYSGDFDPDRTDLRGGYQPILRQKLGRPHGAADFSTIAVWAWGMSQVVSYVRELSEIDPARVAIVGHSRLGKTALLCGAFDDRVQVVISHQAGCGGSAPSRGKIGEPVERINTVFPHWFNDNFKTFNKSPDRLPFDQNCLAALVAPRSLLFSNAVKDTWANPDGQLEVLKSANSVWQLYGKAGIDSAAKPVMNELIGDRLGYFLRPGEHSMNRQDWKAFLDFADREFAKNPAKGE
ncbi:alpha/beta hydrolase family protein [Tuwongella immobilis]|uniref:4-O-methyl-glucuronoyl methylesterase-like domain-containing protein n=1 Tax=Tuwongella immobilis TaxID=692036 RepID=A0A6C2YQF7_9BACT|nr:acetylxylan esterase [Tuwongella immobilis]VIP03343.1 Uncharacterized protein OS=Singulisphaera acidiphila (strain ATCC BAA-1392 / DSM 18658 / VKM B-2454 / MOB10) GN=Sinac_7037 PE=4 SV=1 [Tuwongella immobilis]VTS04058.1 Uncharacterized protein OS=Singulisphaera acidiphila (strain ATCC BAA-1392 / DSM 18658 / VKM B-2454 / MOB10) GN=Sinac_7037 PE=4 SV=1 [Tuwongella immobilis]